MSKERCYFTINCGSEHVGTITVISDHSLNRNLFLSVEAYLKRKSIKVLTMELTPLNIDDVIDGSDTQRIIKIVKENKNEMTIVVEIKQTYFFF